MIVMVSFLATSSRLVSGFLPLCPSQKSTGPNNPLLEECSDAKVLGTTATPIRYLDGERDMSDELFDEEAVNLPLAEAIQRNILTDSTPMETRATERESALANT